MPYLIFLILVLLFLMLVCHFADHCILWRFIPHFRTKSQNKTPRWKARLNQSGLRQANVNTIKPPVTIFKKKFKFIRWTIHFQKKLKVS